MSDYDLTDRVFRLEQQRNSLLDGQTQLLAEVRSLREDIRDFKSQIAEELGRVYVAVTNCDDGR